VVGGRLVGLVTSHSLRNMFIHPPKPEILQTPKPHPTHRRWRPGGGAGAQHGAAGARHEPLQDRARRLLAHRKRIEGVGDVRGALPCVSGDGGAADAGDLFGLSFLYCTIGLKLGKTTCSNRPLYHTHLTHSPPLIYAFPTPPVQLGA